MRGRGAGGGEGGRKAAGGRLRLGVSTAERPMSLGCSLTDWALGRCHGTLPPLRLPSPRRDQRWGGDVHRAGGHVGQVAVDLLVRGEVRRDQGSAELLNRRQL